MTTSNKAQTSDNSEEVFNDGNWINAINNLTPEQEKGWNAAHEADPENGPTIEAYAVENGIELNYEEGEEA